MRFPLSTIIFPLAVFAAALPNPVVKSNGIAINLTRHAPFLNSDDTVNVDVLKAHVASHRAKVLRGFDNYERNTGTAHPLAYDAGNANGIRERAGAGGPLSYRQEVWLGEISIGTPPKTFNVEINTGASDMFVISSQCTTCTGHTPWNARGSSTARYQAVVNGQPKAFAMSFGDERAVAGVLYVDKVTISGFTAEEQTFGAALHVVGPPGPGGSQLNWAPDGQLGLAFQSISDFPTPFKPLLATLVSNHPPVIEPVFSIKLAPVGGELYIGGVNPDHYRGEFTYAPVTVTGYWQVNIESIQDRMGRWAERGPRDRTNVPAIIDTGCNYIIGDANRVTAMYNAIGGISFLPNPEFYAIPCNAFPDISFTFGGKSFQIPPEFLNLGRIHSGSGMCLSSIIAGDQDAEFWTIGSPFLRGYYTTFEFGDHPRVGFADLQ